MSILVIRHGETASNAKRILQVPETPLSERGRAQAERLGQRLAAAGVSAILSSDYARAHMTAEAVSAATGVPISIETTLRERNFGDLRGTSYEDVGRVHGDIFGEGFEPPGGESWEAFHERSDRSWERVLAAAAATDGNLAVVTHGLVCRAYVARNATLGPDAASTPFANTSVTIIEKAPPHRVELFNCCAHLDDDTRHDRTSVSGI